jgi:anthranilate synthase/aminodeoxychorismate synthase-like glutamine amidotransferase
MSLLIIDNYDSFTFNLFQMIQQETDDQVQVMRNDALNLADIKSLAPAAIVLSPGPGHPKNRNDFGVCADVIVNADQLGCPILGVCLGHQGIAQYCGGTVDRAPQILHGKTSQINVVERSPLFSGLTTFRAMRYHSLVVEEKTLPSCLTVIARDQQADLVMALQHNSLPMFGLQFHPESIGTPEGKLIIRNFLGQCTRN